MDKLNFIAELNSDIEWRHSSLTSIKTMYARYNFTERDRDILIFSYVPIIYSLWEGFVKKTFNLLSAFISSRNSNFNELHINILTHAIDCKIHLSNARSSIDKKIQQVLILKEFISSNIVIEQKIPTESNVNFKVMNKILEIFNYKKLDEDFRKPLDRLLNFRNAIAHGENSILVKPDDINQFCDLVRDLMNFIMDHMNVYIDDELYLSR